MTERTDDIRLLVVDDDPLVRSGLKLMFGGAPGIEIVGEAGDGDGVVDLAADLAPDVVLMDVRMQRVDGVSAVSSLRADPRTRAAAVVMLTTFRSDSVVLDALRAGAAGFLLKHSSPDEIVDAVRVAATGQPTVSPAVLRQLIDHVADEGADTRADAASALDRLSERERQVAFAVAEGLSNTEIAERLFLSLGSVKAHISAALAKLGLENRIQLAILAHDARR